MKNVAVHSRPQSPSFVGHVGVGYKLSRVPLGPSMVAVLTEDGAFALLFRPHLGGFDSSRVPTPGNLPSKAKKMLMPGGQPGRGGGLGAAGIDRCIILKNFKGLWLRNNSNYFAMKPRKEITIISLF